MPVLNWIGKDAVVAHDAQVPFRLLHDVPELSCPPLPPGEGRGEGSGHAQQIDLFGDFNGLPKGADKTDFYHYQGNWQNRMILGDSLQVMASLPEREGLRLDQASRKEV